MAINNLNLRFSADVEEAIASGDIEAVPVLLDDWRKRIGQALNGLSDSIGDASLIITDRGKTLNSALDDVVNLKYPESYPAVPVTLRGDFTDDFDTDDGLTGPHQIAYYHTITGDLHVCDGYLYQYVASMRNGSAIATCLEKNPFLDYTEDFALETCIVDLKPDYDTTYRTHCMLGATDGDATTYQGWPMITGLGSGNSVDFRVVRATSGTELTLIGETDGNVEDQVSDTVTATLSRSDPLYLRIEFESDTDVLTFKYKGAGTGSSWITLGTIDATGHFTGDLSVAVLIMGGSTTKTTHWAMYDYLTVEYTPENTGDTYAFITAAAFGSYKKNHIYVRKTDGTFFDINPADIGNGKTADWLTVAAMGKLWRWDNDNSQWVVFRQPPTPHASRHYDGADDELAVDELPEARSPGNDVSNVLKPDGSGRLHLPMRARSPRPRPTARYPWKRLSLTPIRTFHRALRRATSSRLAQVVKPRTAA